MRVDWDVPIEMDDGLVLRADVYRPDDGGRYPVLLSYGPYAKGLAFQEGYPSAWNRMAEEHPDVVAGSTNKYQSWEVCDPEKWVPDGYVCLRIDARGCGRSPGHIDHFSPRETQDLYDCIEWAAVQPWSDGKIGISGVSYYAMNQWAVASRQPPHLVAMIPWEGAAEWYRDSTHHGGILCTFWDNWYDMQVKTVQHGLGTRGAVNSNTGELVSGSPTLSEEELAANRCAFGDDICAHPFDDEYHADRSPVWDKVAVPVPVVGQLGRPGSAPAGQLRGLHPVGVTGAVAGGARHRALDRVLHRLRGGLAEALLRALPQGRRHRLGQPAAGAPAGAPRRRFRGAGRGRLADPAHRLAPDVPARQRATALQPLRPGRHAQHEATGDGLTFLTAPTTEEMEITGPLAAKLFVSSSTADADLFVVYRVFDPDGTEVTFMGAIDPHTPIAQGWLRASHRRLDPELSEPWRPYHTHLEAAAQPLVPGEVYELDIEIWPTCIVVPPGYRIGFSVRGRDYEYGGDTSGMMLSNFKNELRGCGPFLHNDPATARRRSSRTKSPCTSARAPQLRPRPGDPACLSGRGPGGPPVAVGGASGEIAPAPSPGGPALGCPARS